MRQADVGSDHNLLVKTVALKFRKTKMGGKRKQRFEVEQLKDTATKNKFKTALWNKLNILQDTTALSIDAFNEAFDRSS
jgi:hypothetical protein